LQGEEQLGMKEFANPGELSSGESLKVTGLRIPTVVEANRHHDLTEGKDVFSNH